MTEIQKILNTNYKENILNGTNILNYIAENIDALKDSNDLESSYIKDYAHNELIDLLDTIEKIINYRILYNTNNSYHKKYVIYGNLDIYYYSLLDYIEDKIDIKLFVDQEDIDEIVEYILAKHTINKNDIDTSIFTIELFSNSDNIKNDLSKLHEDLEKEKANADSI